MIDVKEILSDEILLESRKYGPCRHIFDDGSITFAGIRDMFGRTLGKGVQVRPVLNETAEDIPEIDIELKDVFSDGPEFQSRTTSDLERFIDGLGWKCTLDQYVQDRYSRYIVNKAREYGIDVSRLSDFVRCLAARLSRISTSRPTRSDLATYAKLDGVRTRCDQYRNFLNDLELNADSTNTDIIRPVEEFVMELCLTLMKNIYGFACLDRSKNARRIAARFGDCPFEPEQYDMSTRGIRAFKRDFHALSNYAESIPADGVRICRDGQTYCLIGNFDGLSEIAKLVGGLTA